MLLDHISTCISPVKHKVSVRFSGEIVSRGWAVAVLE